jgi:hypothetical protein
MRGVLALAALAFALPLTATAQTDVPGGYELVWADEFDGEGLPDPEKWAWDTHANSIGWYNNELQYYAAERPENARVEDGRLIITARKESLRERADWGGQGYTSARLITKGKAEWTYGFFEVRAKLPCGAGSWPAIWTLGATQSWPDGGEIDIMEHVGSTPADVFGTIHNRSTAGTFGNGGSIKVEDACEAFHDYQMAGRTTRSPSRSMEHPSTAIARKTRAARSGLSTSRNTCCSIWRSEGRWGARSTMRSSPPASRSSTCESTRSSDALAPIDHVASATAHRAWSQSSALEANAPAHWCVQAGSRGV